MRHSHGLRAASGKAGWDLSAAIYNGTPINFFLIEEQETLPTSLFFKNDGTKLYAVGTSSDNVNEYDLSTAWDISTASFLQSFSVAANSGNAQGLFFKDDGTKFYTSDPGGQGITEYNLSTAWNISTASFLQVFSVATQTTLPRGLFFKPDGTKFYIMASASIYEYNLSTAWNISTASFLQATAQTGVQTTLRGLFFKPDGTKLFTVGTLPDQVFEYDLSSAWNSSTLSYTYPSTEFFSIKTQDNDPTDLFFKPDGTKLYTTGNTGNEINEYNLSTSWDVTTASFLRVKSITAQSTSPQGLFFKDDGTKLYVIDDFSDNINEYDLATAWDISTASFLQSFSVAAQETAPQGLVFKDDGTKLYVVGEASDSIIEYNLSTAWNISTASFLQSFSVAAQDALPSGLFFRPDGAKVYVAGNLGDAINEYNLSTAWDIGTASFVQSFSVENEDFSPEGLFFKPDGTKLYIVGGRAQAIWSYDL